MSQPGSDGWQVTAVTKESTGENGPVPFFPLDPVRSFGQRIFRKNFLSFSKNGLQNKNYFSV